MTARVLFLVRAMAGGRRDNALRKANSALNAKDRYALM